MDWFDPFLPFLSRGFIPCLLDGLPGDDASGTPRPCLILPDLMVGEVTRSALAAPFGRSPFPFVLLAN